MFARFHRVLILICTFWEELAGNNIYPKSQSFFFLIANWKFSTLKHIKKQTKKQNIPFLSPSLFLGNQDILNKVLDRVLTTCLGLVSDLYQSFCPNAQTHQWVSSEIPWHQYQLEREQTFT